MALKKKVNFLKIKEIILSELKKIKSHPSQFVYEFILEKSFRGIDGYAANSKIPGVKIAKIKMKNDPRNVPLGGARVKYAIASTGPANDSVYSKAAPVEQFIFGDKTLDTDYYIQVGRFDTLWPIRYGP